MKAQCPRFFRDPNVKFPLRPVFAKGLSIREVPRGLGIEFHGGPRRFILRGSATERLYTFLQQSLDGSRTLDDLLHCLPDGISRETLFDGLRLLHQRGALVEAEGASIEQGRAAHPVTLRVQEAMDAFWARKLTVTRSADSAREISWRIGGASVVSVTSGLVGQLTIELLGRSGTQAIEIFPLDDFPVLAGSVTRRTPTEDRGKGLDAWRTDLRRALEQADLLMAATRGATPLLIATLNDLSLELDRPLLLANEDGEQAKINFVYPRRSACLICKQLRESLVSEFGLEDYLFREEDADADHWLPYSMPSGESVSAAALVAAQTVGEAVRFFAGTAPLAFVNATLIIDLLSGESHLSSILRVPRCPACSWAPLSGGAEAGVQ